MGALAASLPAGWTSTSSLLVPRFGHTATLIPSVNWVLVAGGSDTSGRSGNHPLASSEIYYAQFGRWGPVADMLEARYGHAAVFLRHGPGETRDQVLVLGGVGTRGALASAELFDPLTKTWRATRPMSRPRGSPLATLLADGRVLVTGGSTPKSFASADAEIYDPATGTWSSTGAMATPRSVYVQSLLPDGTVMVAGGATSVTNPVTGRPVGKSLDAVEIWNPQTGVWSAGPTLPAPRDSSSWTVLSNGSLLVAGGLFSDGQGGGMDILASTVIYEPKARAWTQEGDLPATLQGTKDITALNDGRALVIGGFTRARAGQFLPASAGWILAGDSPETAWVGFTTTTLPNGRVLFAGGDVGLNPAPSAISYLYDPKVVAATAAAGDRLAWLRDPASWVGIAAGALLFALAAMLVATRRPRAWRWARPFVAAIFQIAGLFLFTWLLVQAAGLAPPPTSNGDVAGAARVGELNLLKQPIPVIIWVASARSLVLVALAAVWATFIGVGMAVAAVSLRRRWLDILGGSVALLWVAPTFLLAILVQEMQASLYGHTGLVVAAGFGDVNAAQVFWSSVVLALRPATYLYSQTREALEVELREQYTRTALAKGVPYHWMVMRHALAAATGRVLAVWLNSLRLMVGALPLVEFFFGYPGLGRILILSLGLTYAGGAGAANSNLTVALLVTMGALLIVAEAIASMVKTAVDPRLRRSGMAA